jgi:hypothetical protein
MSDLTAHFVDGTGAAADSAAEAHLSPRAKVFVIIGMALAAWVPVLVPFFLILHR